MMEQSEKKILAELMQYGYDRNVIALADMKGIPELEEQFDALTTRSLKSVWDWFGSSEQEFDDVFKHHTALRICFTVGIGAVWFWLNKKDDVDQKGLFECMAEPRSEYAMDEYIEDVTGIWWSPNSADHIKYRDFFDNCYEQFAKRYNLTNEDEEHKIGHVLMLLGMYCGYTRHFHSNSIDRYTGTMPWHWEVWQELYGKDENLENYTKYACEAITNGKQTLGGRVILDDEDSEFGKKSKFYSPCTLNEQAGMRTIAYIDDNRTKLLTSIPVFDTTRSYHIVIDKVRVWKSGAEATITAHFHDDEDCEITFYDTNYLENKDRYFAGLSYIFDLYGIAYRAKIVEEKYRSFQFEGQKVLDFNKKIKAETTFDENGNPEPMVFRMENLHSFIQNNNEIPEDAEFRSPIKAVYDDVEFLGKKVYEIEIGIPYRDWESDKRHPLSVYVAADTADKLTERPSVNEPIQGILYLQGKMRRLVNSKEIPSTVIHTFDAKEEDGSMAIFTHVCEDTETGMPMNTEEQKEFAKIIYKKLLCDSVSELKIEKTTGPDFSASRNREVWIKTDTNYSAEKDFVEENKYQYIDRYYSSKKKPVIAYISLYDENGNECKWLKGGKYTAKISYGSVYPGQKMDINKGYSHKDLIQILFESYQKLDTRFLSCYLHKDLDFRSPNIYDPIITKEEYLERTERLNEANREAEEGPVKPILVYDDINDEMYIELKYPKGNVDIVKIVSNDSLITSIVIENKTNI